MTRTKKQFTDYSQYYDLLYSSKEYRHEVNFLVRVLKKYSKRKVNSILSLGCGTVAHDLLLAQKGFKITGVDTSKTMLAIAHKKIKEAGVSIDLFHGDVRKVRLKKKFDAVMAMFNIAGYQRSAQDFDAFVHSAEQHTKHGGLFFFDAWYQPCVLLDRPKNVKKVIQLEKGIKISRITKQTLDVESGLIEIFFTIKKQIKNKIVEEFTEQHTMAFFTLKEVEYFLKKHKFEVVNVCKFGDMDTPISQKYWNMFVIARRV